MILNIQALRGVAAFMVVIFHLQTLAERAGAPKDVFLPGNGGVDIFFVISGVIMVVASNRPGAGAGRFLRDRITRLAPLYWAVTLATFAIALAAPSLMESTRADPVQLIASLLFIPVQDATGWVRPTVLVGWTLNYEMAFYVLFAVGLLFPVRRLGLAFVVAVIALTVTAGQLLGRDGVLAEFYTAPIILEFAAGVILGSAISHAPEDRRLVGVAAPVALLAFGILLASGWLWPNAERVLAYGLPALVLVACALLMEKAGLTVGNRTIQLLGAASYSIYLTHFFVTRLAIVAAERLGLTDPAALLGLGLAALLAVAAAGVACYRLVELPLTKQARRGLGYPRARQVNPAV